jgi:CheY-like chemotaxis protein
MKKPWRILAIDDEASFTRLLKLNLEGTGSFLVREANSGTEGLAAAREFQPDLILLDIIMPDMSGGEVAAKLKADPKLKNTSVIFLTALISQEQAKTASRRGRYPYLAKPVTVKELTDGIRKQLETPRAVAARSGRKARILVIDDEPAFTELLRLNLEGSGAYEVRAEHDARKALETVRAFRPDLIVLDLIMPEVGGAELSEQLKADATLRDIPVVFSSAIVSKESLAASGGMLEGEAYLVKPFTVEELLARLQQCLKKQRPRVFSSRKPRAS